MITGNEPAMPFEAATDHTLLSSHLTGLTIRQHFAALAMQGMLAANSHGLANGIVDIDGFVSLSVKMSDALIDELNKTS